MNNSKTVYLLIGPKGSGKTHIGQVVEEELGVRFLWVERMLMEYINTNNLTISMLERHGLDIQEEKIDEILRVSNEVVFDSTGASKYLQDTIVSLSTKYEVKLIRILCPLSICIDRINERKSPYQFDVSLDVVNEINSRSEKCQLSWDLEVDNSKFISNHTIVENFKSLIDVSK